MQRCLQRRNPNRLIRNNLLRQEKPLWARFESRVNPVAFRLRANLSEQLPPLHGSGQQVTAHRNQCSEPDARAVVARSTGSCTTSSATTATCFGPVPNLCTEFSCANPANFGRRMSQSVMYNSFLTTAVWAGKTMGVYPISRYGPDTWSHRCDQSRPRGTPLAYYPFDDCDGPRQDGVDIGEADSSQ